MRLRNVPGARDAIADSKYVIQNPEEARGNWSERFGNKTPIFLEIGMGKGLFLMELARQHPDRNYIGIEKYDSVLIRALEKCNLEEIQNLLFVRLDANDLLRIFEVEEISGIFLNFSDPWPKDRHVKRRLTSKEFLQRYDQILEKDGRVEFKTDNRKLFDFSVEQAKEAGWRLEVCTYDLHNDEEHNQGNVMTEYEAKFSKMGHPIHKMVIHR